jgi:DNA-binding transcriptional ArsR family regulator
MKEGPDIARIAALIGDPARANMLTALMSGKALTVTELAGEAGVTIQTASGHLTKLEAGGMLAPRKQGRHKYFALAGPEVARVLENLMGLAAGAGHLRQRIGPKDAEMRHARVCYNHLAGTLGTRMYDAMTAAGHLAMQGDALILTPQGAEFVVDFGIDLAALRAKRLPLCRDCLDWSARRSHLAGSLGRAMLTQIETLGWARRVDGTRVMRFSKAGEAAFHDQFSA